MSSSLTVSTIFNLSVGKVVKKKYINADDIDDDRKLGRKYSNKRVNAEKEKIQFNLSFDDFCFLIRSAGLKSSDLGFTGKNYVLARFNDTGPYAIGNCRFISHKENMAERTISEKQSAAAARHIRRYNESLTHEDRVNRIKNSEKFQSVLRKRIAQSKINLAIKDEAKHPSFKGSRNSQYGSYWITDGTNNKKWRDDFGSPPDGFTKGRIAKK